MNRVRRSVLADQVKDHLLQDILSGRYPPHSRIVETQVARELGTSQAPVREALRGLEAVGVVDILPFRGARVRRPATTEILEAIELRAALETFGARRSVVGLDDAALAELETLHDAIHAAARRGDPHAVAIADAAFHAALINRAGHATLERLWRALDPFARTYLTAVVPGVDVRWSADLHGPIIEALRARDVDAVVAALERHFAAAAAKVREGWTEDSASTAGRPVEGVRGVPRLQSIIEDTTPFDDQPHATEEGPG